MDATIFDKNFTTCCVLITLNQLRMVPYLKNIQEKGNFKNSDMYLTFTVSLDTVTSYKNMTHYSLDKHKFSDTFYRKIVHKM